MFWPVPASSGLFWPSLGGATEVAGRNGLFDAPAVVSRESRCVSMEPSFRRSCCGFARIPLRFDAPAVVSREFRPLLASSGGHLGCGPQRRTRWGRLPLWFRASSVSRIPLRFDAPALWLPAKQFQPLVASSGLFCRGHLGCGPRWGGAFVSTLASPGLFLGGHLDCVRLWPLLALQNCLGPTPA